MSYEEYEKRLLQREIFDKLREAEREAASDNGRLTVSEVFDQLIQELEAMTEHTQSSILLP